MHINDRIKALQNDRVKTFVADIGRALSGMYGDVDEVCDKFTDEYDRHTAQAILQLIEKTNSIRQQATQDARRQARQESGFFG